MSFLLDTDTCSAHLKRPSGLMHRFMQHSRGLYIPTIVLGELYAWAYHRQNPTSIIQRIDIDLLQDVGVLVFDSDCAKEFGRVRGALAARRCSRVFQSKGCHRSSPNLVYRLMKPIEILNFTRGKVFSKPRGVPREHTFSPRQPVGIIPPWLIVLSINKE